MPDPVRLLHKRSAHGYTSNPARALFAEPEAVGSEIQRAITAEVHQSAHDRQVEQWRERQAAIARELEWLKSQRFRRDVRSAVRGLERQLAQLDHRIAG